MTDIADILRDQRLIEPHALAQLVDLLLRCARTEGHARRVARHDAGEHENHQRQHEQHHEEADRAPRKQCDVIIAHWQPFPLGRLSPGLSAAFCGRGQFQAERAICTTA
ncbi:hypothetical protein D3C87_1771020 [compost metagenome]